MFQKGIFLKNALKNPYQKQIIDSHIYGHTLFDTIGPFVSIVYF
jgi:hypothetical protein